MSTKTVKILAAILATAGFAGAFSAARCAAQDLPAADVVAPPAEAGPASPTDPGVPSCAIYDPSPAYGTCPPSDLWTRQTLTNGFGGLQADLASRGIVYNAFFTQFYQGAASGGAEQEFQYGGKLDQFVIFDGEKLGLWKGFSVSMHAETRVGQDVNQAAVGF